VVNLEHLVPSERPFAWLGVLRPSEACAGVLAKLGAAAAPATRDRLQALQVCTVTTLIPIKKVNPNSKLASDPNLYPE